MKKIFMTFAAAAVVFGMVSCDKNSKSPTKPAPDDDDDPEYVSLITVDGKFADWDAVPAADLKTVTCPSGKSKDAMKVMKVCADELYIYFYFEISNDPKVFTKSWAPMTILIDDNDPATVGATMEYVFNGSFEYCIQGAFASQGSLVSFAPSVRKWVAAETLPFWDHESDGSLEQLVAEGNATFASGAGVEEGQLLKYELRMMRGMLPTIGNSLKVGAYFSESVGWAQVGALPALADTDAVDTPADMLEVTLPAAAE